MPTKKKAIALQDILRHMQSTKQEFLQRFDKIDIRLDRVESKVDGLEHRMERVEKKVDLISTQINNIDESLDDIEVKKLPKIQTAVFGKH